MAALNDPIFDFFFPMGFFFFCLTFRGEPISAIDFFFGHKCANWTVRQQREDLLKTRKGTYCMVSKEEEKKKILSESDKPRSIIVFTR